LSKIIAVIGMTGCGKSEAVKFFVSNGYKRVYFGEVVMNVVKGLGLDVNESNERTVRESLRKEFGMGAMAVKSLPAIEEFIGQGENVVVESLYSWSEYQIMNDKFQDDFKLLTIYTTKSIRYERLSKRIIRPLTKFECMTRDKSEIENIEKGGPIAFADYLVMNDGTIEELNLQLKKYL